MNANKFLKWMGLLFVGLGAVMGIGMLVGMSAICPYCGRKVVAGKDGIVR